MAIYKSLSLAAGGGITSPLQQAEQAEGTVSLLIGLGGTGIDCIRAIKTQVHKRIRPDDSSAAVPTYERIRFLAVDNDRTSCGRDCDSYLMLNENEFFSIANPNVDRALMSTITLSKRKEFEWLSNPSALVDVLDDPLGRRGLTNAIRQRGRFLLMDKADAFIDRVENQLKVACEEMSEPTASIHIFAGLSGGTGSGVFLDVCYMVCEVAETFGASVYGYFFLPDVNTSRIYGKGTSFHYYLQRNGYAALQELDYCMRLPDNGGSFEQVYKGGKRIRWDKPPVDMCFLVGATNAEGYIAENPYDYTISAVSEYVMDFLTNGCDNVSLARVKASVEIENAAASFGVCVSYASIGGACASVPTCEINTYLASELFHRFDAAHGGAPALAEVDALAVAALGAEGSNARGIYESLLTKVREDANGEFIALEGGWRTVSKLGISRLMDAYAEQIAERSIAIERNAAHLVDQDDEASLIRRIDCLLAEGVRDVSRGPMWAHGMLDDAWEYNLLFVVDRLIEENAAWWEQERRQDCLREEEYEKTWRKLEVRKNAVFGMGCKKRFEAYEWDMHLLLQHWLSLYAYEALDGVLRTLREQLAARDSSYYAKLAHIMSDLADTFDENRDTLKRRARVYDVMAGFEQPAMSVVELRRTLDEELRHLDVSSMFDSFMGTFLDNGGEWVDEDEAHISRLVNTFFVNQAFSDCSGWTIMRFLKHKYGTNTDEELANMVYREWMCGLTAKASPLFHFDASVWDQSKTSSTAFISVPEAARSISAAAQLMHQADSIWQVKQSAFTDRIYVTQRAAVFPVAAYSGCRQYEESYFSHTVPIGCHLYEAPDIEGMPFSDWRKLPPLTPQQLVHMDLVPYQVRENVRAGRDLFDRAEAAGLFDEERQILRPSEASLRLLDTAVEECERVAASLSSPDQIAGARLALSNLEAAGNLQMEPTGERFQNDGRSDTPEVRRSVFLDLFIASPAYQLYVRRILGEVDAAHERAGRAKATLEQQIEKVGIGNWDVADYTEALFTDQ